MRSVIKGIVAASLLAGATVAAAAPAEARWHDGGGYYGGYHGGYGGYHGGWHRGGVSTGTAVAAGLLGLGIGAAIASSDRGPGYYDGGYYAPPPPAYGYGYYAPPPPVYYDDDGW